MISNVVILAGGFGTRSENPRLPKVLQQVSSDKRIIDFLIDQLDRLDTVTKVFWLLGHGAEQVAKVLSLLRPNDTTREDGVKGTAKALLASLDLLQDGQTLIVLGDTFFGMPLGKVLSRIDNDADLVFFGRQSDHVFDSDQVEVSEDRQISNFIPKGVAARKIQGTRYGLTGLTVASKELIASIDPSLDLQLGLFLASKNLGKPANFIPISWYSRDTGTSERLRKVRSDLESGVYARRSSPSRGAIFLDRDGTLIPDIGESRKSVASSDIPKRVAEAIAQTNSLGIPLFMVTNQPGIAKGMISRQDVAQCFMDISHLLADSLGHLDDFYYCPHHPDRGWSGEIVELKVACDCRKPGAGMLRKAEIEHDLSPENSFVIGDTNRDEGAATNWRANFLRVSWTHSGVEVAKAIALARSEILNSTGRRGASRI
jgi:D,D-heptose 1,7-bisphosphate phosphatase